MRWARKSWPTSPQLGLSLKEHPVALVRDHLNQLKIMTAAHVTVSPHGAGSRSGSSSSDQRPGTASVGETGDMGGGHDF